jgi:hypothetical protein
MVGGGTRNGCSGLVLNKGKCKPGENSSTGAVEKDHRRDIKMWKWLQVVITMLVVQLGVLSAVVPAQAAESDMDLLASFIGDWRGEGSLVGGDRPEPFRCRLTVSRGNQGKINYAGRCSLVDTNLSVSGTILYNEGANRYEAAMSSNAGFTGTAVGRVSGEQIVFDLQEQQTDRAGSEVRIGAGIVLVANQITVNFEVEFNNSGHILRASVPFSRS